MFDNFGTTLSAEAPQEVRDLAYLLSFILVLATVRLTLHRGVKVCLLGLLPAELVFQHGEAAGDIMRGVLVEARTAGLLDARLIDRRPQGRLVEFASGLPLEAFRVVQELLCIETKSLGGLIESGSDSCPGLNSFSRVATLRRLQRHILVDNCVDVFHDLFEVVAQLVRLHSRKSILLLGLLLFGAHHLVFKLLIRVLLILQLQHDLLKAHFSRSELDQLFLVVHLLHHVVFHLGRGRLLLWPRSRPLWRSASRHRCLNEMRLLLLALTNWHLMGLVGTRPEGTLLVRVLHGLTAGAILRFLQVRLFLRRIVEKDLLIILTMLRHLFNLHLDFELHVTLVPIRVEAHDVLQAFHVLHLLLHKCHLSIVLLLLLNLLLNVLDLDCLLLEVFLLLADRYSLY